VESSARCRGILAVLAMALAGVGFNVRAAAAEAALPRDYIAQLAGLINDYRQAQGLGPLTLTQELGSLAHEHSASMASQHLLSHEGFRARFQRAGSKLCVENVGSNYATPEGLFAGWRLSPAHHRNLVEPQVSRMGLAADARYVTFFACR